MTWRAYFIKTMTGEVGPEIEMSTDGRWDIMLNSTERQTVTVQKYSMGGIESLWFSPWRGGILLTFTPFFEGEEGEEIPIVAGPITGPPAEYPESLSFTMLGIRSVFAHRVLLDQDYLSGSGSRPSAKDLQAVLKSKLAYEKAPLAFIAQDIVRRGMDKQMGQLPITFGRSVPARDEVSGVTITYDGFDLANADIDRRLTQLTDRIEGPDVMFRPEWANESHTHLRWVMHNGNHVSPVIEQDWVMSIDTTAPQNSLAETTLNTDGEHYATRVYATGAGEGSGIALAARDGEALYRQEHPLLESVISAPDVTSAQTLDALAAAAVDVRPKVELHLTVDGNDPTTQLGRWHVGDTVEVTVRGWLSIPDGTHDMRLVRAAGDLDDGFAVLYFQEDQW